MADFVEVIKIRKRMCESIRCNECGLSGVNNGKGTGCENFSTRHPEQAQEIILKWAEERPIKTNADKFREMFGLAEEEFNPATGCSYLKCSGRRCCECPKRNFWFDEYKEPEVRE